MIVEEIQHVVANLPKLHKDTPEAYCRDANWSMSQFYNTYNRITNKTVEQLEHIVKILEKNREVIAQEDVRKAQILAEIVKRQVTIP